jgi:pimeloyl-ACP methyl ester carboxylesterase
MTLNATSLKVLAAYGLVLTAAACAPSVSAAADPPGEEAIEFSADGGDTVAAFRGTLMVRENRSDADSRMIPLVYVRFPSTGDESGPPVIYLAGGPGGSGIATARGPRFPLFMAMREFGDVIAFDQRGTGEAKETPTCTSSVVPPADRRLAEEAIVRLYREAAEECAAEWQAQGVDIAGYTTAESAADLDALRVHLGAEKISLWGISYGTHLALAALKTMDDRIDRVVLASAEGLDQTAKLPAETDAYFARLQAAIDADPEMRAALQDIAGLIRRVHARLDDAPVLVEVDRGDGSTGQVLLAKETLQVVASRLIADPYSALRVIRLYQALDEGRIEPVKGLLEWFFPPDEPIAFEAMPLAMDVASGISDERLAVWQEQARTALLGPYLNFPMPQLRGALGLDLGDDFRARPVSDVPTLLLTGTLDGRTYPPEQAAAVSGLTDLTHVTVVNAGHNLFMTTPEVTEAIQQFMRDEPVAAREIIAPLPEFPPDAE